MSTTERPLAVGSRRIGPAEPCYVIAEVGINHNGDLGTARRLIDVAAIAGANAVTSISERSTPAAMLSTRGSRPISRCSVKLRVASASSLIDWSTLYATTGR